jgi:hypothetical protein
MIRASTPILLAKGKDRSVRMAEVSESWRQLSTSLQSRGRVRIIQSVVCSEPAAV